MTEVIRRMGNDPTVIFDELYRNMSVVGFGRLGKFDYLSMLGRYNLAPISAGSAYLDNATGPIRVHDCCSMETPIVHVDQRNFRLL